MNDPSRKISDNLSVYLDFLRLSAAIIVFLTHGHNFLLPDIKFGPFAWGREAVAVFFVLSGFVISYVTQTSEKDWRVYVVARVARILPVAVLAILVIVVADMIGTSVNPAYYDYVNGKFDGFYVPISADGFWSYLTFTNQLWFRHSVFGTGEPYWSLGFEVQYYLFWALLCFVPARLRLAIVLFWAVVVGPKILMYMPLWLMGVVAQTYRHKFQFGMKGSWALFILPLLVFLVVKQLLGPSATNMFKTYALSQELVNFVYFNLIGICVALHIVGAASLFRSMPTAPDRLRASIKWLAAGSFTLYLAHQSILVMVAALLPPVESHVALAAVMLLVSFALCYLLAEVAERRKKFFAGLLRKYLPWLKVPVAARA